MVKAPLYSTVTMNKTELKTRKANKAGYNALILACEDQVSLNIVEQARSVDHPRGDDHLEWEGFKDKFEPDGRFTIIYMKDSKINLNQMTDLQ